MPDLECETCHGLGGYPRCPDCSNAGGSDRRAVRSLRLWLPKYHSPSLNVTAGAHWKVLLGHKQAAARALCSALRDQAGTERAQLVLDALAKGGRAGEAGKAVRAAARRAGAEAKSAARLDPKRERTQVRYVRVTCAPLDAENFAGSTKGLTDCLRDAFPDLLPDDAEEFLDLTHSQQRCGRKCEEGTWVEVCGAGVRRRPTVPRVLSLA